MRPGVSREARTMLLYEANKKEMAIAYLLWFFLGGFGAHNFYLERTGVAVAQLILTLTLGLSALNAVAQEPGGPPRGGDRGPGGPAGGGPGRGQPRPGGAGALSFEANTLPKDDTDKILHHNAQRLFGRSR